MKHLSHRRASLARGAVVVALVVAGAPGLLGCAKKEPREQAQPELRLDRVAALLGSSPDEALQQLEQVPEPWPASAHYLKALAHEAKQQHDFATAAFERALELDPAFTEARRAHAAMLIRTGRVQPGLAQVRLAIERDPKDLLSPLLLAACANQAELRREALAALQAWKASNPAEANNAPAEYLLAVAALESDANAAKANSQQAKTARLRSVEASLGLVRVAAAQGNRGFAARLLDKLASSTKDRDALVRIAELALGIDDVSSAGTALDQLPLTQPTSDVVVLRGKHALAAKRPAEAVKYFEQGLAMVPVQDPAARSAVTLHLASAQAANEQRPRAMETLKGLLQRAPDDRAAIVLLSHLELVSENPRAGVERLAALAQKHPNDSDALRLLANAQLAAGDASSAESNLRKLAAKLPDDPTIAPKLATALAAQKRHAAAIAELQAALGRFAGDLGIVRALASLLVEQQRGAEAVALVLGVVKQAATNEAKSVDARLLLAELYRRQSKPQQARQALLALVNDVPNSDRVWAAVLAPERESAEFSEAELGQLEAALRRALESEPTSSKHKARLAALLVQRGKRADAAQLYGQFVSASSDDPVALNNAAMLLCEQEATQDEAVKLAERAKELMPDNPAILDTLGWALLRRGSNRDIARAKALLNQAAVRLPTAEVQFHLGAAKIASGDGDEGRQLIRRALAESKSEHWRGEAEQWLAKPAPTTPSP